MSKRMPGGKSLSDTGFQENPRSGGFDVAGLFGILMQALG
jgi:hypothetical protein